MIFVDTSFWVALRNRRDSHHTEARELLSSPDLSPLLTTNHVIGETWTFLRRRAGHEPAVAFLEVVNRSERLAIEHVTETLEGQALRWLRRHDERKYAFVDATSFQVMINSRIDTALAFDGDFAAAGFVELRLG
ncbi:MAG: PIN domain-containing protein [Actinomycetota bacterium]|nr:PIN domain-containing protein [Actinomycetota bacterium]